jgi:hypothetical protein
MFDNGVSLYHRNGAICAERWSCEHDDHTAVPPRCATTAAGRALCCELPAGHPGPHVAAVAGPAAA